MNPKSIGVLGGGAWGTGLAQALANGGNKVSMWALEPEVKDSVNNEHENKRYLPGYKLSENLTVSNDIIEVAIAAVDHIFDWKAYLIQKHGYTEEDFIVNRED